MSAVLDLSLWSRARIRLVRQVEAAECGLACIAMVASYHGLKTDIGTLRRRFNLSMRGVSLKSLMVVADRIGLSPRPVSAPLGQLKALHLPAILHWDMNHFVVLEAVRGNKLLIHDPAGMTAWLPEEEVSRHFTGVALELRPTGDFAKGQEAKRLPLSYLWDRMTGLKRSLAQVLVLSLVMQVYVIALPYYTQVAIDSAVPARDHDLLTVLALGFGLLTLVNSGATFLRSFVLLAAGSSAGFGVSSNIARRLFRLPADWFEKRAVGDVLSRFQSVTPIQKLLTEGAVAALVDGSLAVMTLVLMLLYSPVLALITVVALLLYVALRVFTFSSQRAAQEESIVDKGKEQTHLIETIRGITTLRLFGREMWRHSQWQSKLAAAISADIRLARVGIWQTTANISIFNLENIVSVWLAVNFVIDGGFSVGMVFAFMAYKTQFVQKTTSLIDQGITFRMLKLHLERLADIALSEEDETFGESFETETKLNGHFEMRNLSFRYGAADPLVLQGVNLVVEPGAHVAITGPSGGGKSTLVKLLLGLVKPLEGEVLVDGLTLPRFGYRSFREQVATVLQEDNLFAGSLRENIALFDDAPDDDRIVEAATAASIHNDIMQMPMQYQTLVGDMGASLSGGQKQRVLLARALYRKPRVLIMDEGTAHLDSMHERAVNAAIAAAGITRIIVAHRAETLANADRVLILADGKLTELPRP